MKKLKLQGIMHKTIPLIEGCKNCVFAKINPGSQQCTLDEKMYKDNVYDEKLSNECMIEPVIWIKDEGIHEPKKLKL